MHRMAQACVVSSKSFLPHVIHVCTWAFVFVVLQSLSTFDGHFLFFDNFIKPTSQIALPAIEPCAPIPRNEDHASLSKTTPLTGSERNVTDNSDDFQVTASVFQRSSVKTVHDLGDDDAETPDAEIDDEHIRNALTLPLYTQEREADAFLRQTYHSNEEGLFPGAESSLASTAKPVAWLTQERKSSRSLATS